MRESSKAAGVEMQVSFPRSKCKRGCVAAICAVAVCALIFYVPIISIFVDVYVDFYYLPKTNPSLVPTN